MEGERSGRARDQSSNRVTRGWSNYFSLAHYHRSFKQMNYFVAHRLRQWLWRKPRECGWKIQPLAGLRPLSAPMDFSDCRAI